MIEVATGEYRACARVGQSVHASQLQRREVGSFVHQNLVPVAAHHSLQGCPLRAVDCSLNVAAIDQLVAGFKGGQQDDIQLQWVDVSLVKTA